MIRRRAVQLRRRLALGLGLLLIAGLLVTTPVADVLGPPAQAHASVAVDDLVFSQADPVSGSHIMLRHGSTETQLTSGTYDAAQGPDVSPDGSRIVFYGPVYDFNEYGTPVAGGNYALFVMNSDGSGLTQVTFPNLTDQSDPAWFYDMSPRWSGDGTKIVFTRKTYDTDLNRYHWHIWTVNADGSGATDLTASDTVESDSATFSPDGSKIAYVHDVQSSPQIWLMNVNGSDKHLVDPSVYGGYYPEWSPDGTRIYFSGYDSGPALMYMDSTDGFADVSNSSAHLVYSNPTSGSSLRISGDGSTMYYDGSNTNIYKVDISNHTETQVTSGEYNSGPTPVKTAWSIKHFTVIGDSFSSGEGNEPFISGTSDDGTNECHRSDAAYAEVLDHTPVGLSLTSFVACSGATTDALGLGMWNEPSQLLAPASTDNYLILTIGGNDIQFDLFAKDCVWPNSDCDGSDQDIATEGLIENTLPDKLDALFSDIAVAVSGTDTRVLVLGYPYILPSDPELSCPFMSSGERTEATNVQIGINGAINAAVNRAETPFEFVDPNVTGSPFEGHELCTPAPFFNGLDLVNQEYSFHPNTYGQAAYAQVILDYLAANPS